jgi:hypothetical protein
VPEKLEGRGSELQLVKAAIPIDHPEDDLQSAARQFALAECQPPVVATKVVEL